MKKILLTTILLAAGSAVAESALTGIHLGVDAGLQRADFNQYLDASNGPRFSHAKVKKPSYQWTGAASLGYFKDSNDLHYGAKFSFGSVFGDRIKKPTDSTGQYEPISVKLKQQYSLALVGHLGTYVSNDTVVYGSLGIKRLRYDLELKSIETGTPKAVNGTVGRTLWGPVIGVGMKKALNDTWAFNSELSYEFYSKAKSGSFDSTAGRFIATTIQPRIWSVNIGLSRKF
ncbi:MAG: hypothetical protein FJX18_05645 [Alphaproteobacteria bacterium]|nr:hypothetical protein [Alphaproteobacteria bacterium]